MSQVDMQFKANSTKTKLKQMFKTIDEGILMQSINHKLGKTGYVKEDLFYQLLNLHGVELSNEARTIINSTYKKNDKINYPDAITVICIDMETVANFNE